MEKKNIALKPLALLVLLSLIAALILAWLLVEPQPADNKKVDEGVSISNAYFHLMPSTQTVTAGYLSIHNSSSEAVELVQINSTQVQRIELHLSGMDSEGMMSMRPVESVLIEPFSELVLKPGSYHLMLFGVELAVDETAIDVEFEFRSGQTVRAVLEAKKR